MAEEEKKPSAAEKRYMKPKGEPKPEGGKAEEKPGQEGAKEEPKGEPAPKKAEGEAGEGMGDMPGRHAKERDMLAEAQDKERRDLHGKHRDEHKLMRQKHAAEMDMVEK